jgi:hypothetical protein
VIEFGVLADSWKAEKRQAAGGARPSQPVGADGEGLARSRRTRACCPSDPAANSQPRHEPEPQLIPTISAAPDSYNPNGESPNNCQMATSWTSGWSSDGQRPRPHCPGMRSPPALQAHKLNDGGQRPTNGLGQTNRHHRSATDGQTASLHGMCSPSATHPGGRENDQHFRWSERMWSPPPESNRRPHPYHGTTRNRCAERPFPRSRPTVVAKVIGSPSPKLSLR